MNSLLLHLPTLPALQMRRHAAWPRALRWLGMALAMLAVCMLLVQALHHFQPRMLLDGSVCTSGGAAPAAPDKAQAHAGDCGGCCARAETGVLPVDLALTAWRLLVPSMAVPPLPAPAIQPPVWPTSAPRGPPAQH